MRFPELNSLYGRIFTIFWLSIFLVLLVVLSLPTLDPRKTKDLSKGEYRHLMDIKDSIELEYAGETNLSRILKRLSRPVEDPGGHVRMRFFLTDSDGNLLSYVKRTPENRPPAVRPRPVQAGSQQQAPPPPPPPFPGFRVKALKNFITSIDSNDKPKQRMYGRYVITGPLPIELAQRKLFLYVGLAGDHSPPLIFRLLDSPLSFLLMVMLISTPLLLWLSWALSQPAQRLAQAAQRVARGEFRSDPSLEQGTSEFQQAGQSFNRMVEAVNGMISGQQRLLSDISHELRSPLTRLRMANGLAIRKQGVSTELERIDTEAQRLEQMIAELLELSRMQVNSHMEREVQPLSSLWETLLDDAIFEAEQLSKTLTYTPIPQRVISGNPKLLMSALENITRNAICYGKDQIRVTFTESANQLTIVVEDNGDGVPEKELNDIFRPFYRVSEARDRHSGGAGLGLAITENAIRQHSGSIRASRSNMGGLMVTIELPLSAPNQTT
ncbi:Sensor protein CpxA [Vibrio aerogenes CECT 7868]|uniref:histidine kinase n=1 Tax=Vibrio aerogenes CECT 7868 TaxID=1216006 RepID=A0A1M5YWK5_9VIBR|nr:envelope stress sensor histidine kinase CpxA [Vibrio aerogenes]SHI16220.1 Sensor protein CpxA [Vibrio aerogenes CECT 7868]